MSLEPKKSILVLKVVRDLLVELGNIIDALTKIKGKYGVGMTDLSTLNLANPEIMQELTSILSAEKLGSLLKAVSGIMAIDNDLKNFATYDEDKLKEFKEKLGNIVNNLDKVVE